MRSMSAKDAKYCFGRLIDLARSEPITVEKHGRPVVVVMAFEEYERLRNGANGDAIEPPENVAHRAKSQRGTEKV